MTDYSDITAAFVNSGFSYVYTDNPDILTYSGCIKTTKYGDIHIDFELIKTLTEFPVASVNKKSRHLFIPYHFPHMQREWKICYHDNSVFFDCAKPELYVNFAVTSVTDIFEKFEHDDMQEIGKEFTSYWFAGTGEFYYGCFDEKKESLIIADRKIYNKSDNSRGVTPIYLELETLPAMKNISWPLETLDELKKWLGNTDYDHAELQRSLMRYFRICSQTVYIVIHIKEYELFLGIRIEPKKATSDKRRHTLSIKTVESMIRQKMYDFSRFAIKKTIPLDLILANCDNRKPGIQLPLLYKKIALIGAGTIGSNLANLLIRNGAGMPNDGLLSIIDYERYEPENFSRHFLGTRCIGINKACALETELKYINEYAHIESIPKAFENIDLQKYDVLIDSTGEEALTIFLSRAMCAAKARGLSISVWVSDEGRVAEAFMQPANRDAACYECFRLTDKYVVANKQNYPMRDSCQSIFVPFPVTASLQAAILAVKVIDRFTGNFPDTSMYFRQSIEPIDKLVEIPVTKNMDCGICGKR